MNEVLNTLRTVSNNLSIERGTITMFGLFKRIDLTDDKWDVVISANWVTDRKEEDLVLVINLLKAAFNNNLSFLAKIVLLRENDPMIRAILARTKDKNLPVEFNDELIGDVRFTRFYVINKSE